MGLTNQGGFAVYVLGPYFGKVGQSLRGAAFEGREPSECVQYPPPRKHYDRRRNGQYEQYEIDPETRDPRRARHPEDRRRRVGNQYDDAHKREH